MKKQLLIVLFAAAGGPAWAQSVIPAGAIQLGGNVSYYQRHGENSSFGSSITDNHTFSFNPQAGYFVAANWVLGLGAGYTSDKSLYANSGMAGAGSQHYQSFYVGPFVQHYRMLSERFGLTGTLAASFNRGTTDYERADNPGFYASHASSNGLAAALTPGLVYFPVRRLALGATAGGLYYSYGRGTQVGSDGLTNDWKGSYFGASFGLSSLALSGTYFLRRG